MTFPVPGSALEMPPPVSDARFPVTTQSRTTRSALPTRMPPPSPVTFPLRIVSPWSTTLIELGAAAEHVEHAVELLAVDDREARAGPLDRHRVGDVEVAGDVGVLARAGDG